MLFSPSDHGTRRDSLLGNIEHKLGLLTRPDEITEKNTNSI